MIYKTTPGYSMNLKILIKSRWIKITIKFCLLISKNNDLIYYQTVIILYEFKLNISLKNFII